MEVGERRRSYHTIDGLRGIAALLVVGRHVGPFGFDRPESFLAVDLFFLLSGFVIASAYEKKLMHGGFVGQFFVVRLIRLYPLYALGILLSVIVSLPQGLPPLLPLVIASVLMLPANPLTMLGCSVLNVPVWTLPLELMANMLYAAFFRLITVPVLIVLILAGAAGTLWGVHVGRLDLGWAFGDLPIGLGRLFFSFFAGILMFRLIGDRHGGRPWLAWLCVGMTGVLLAIQVPASWSIYYEAALIFVGFPAIVVVACQTEPGALGARLFRFSGFVSYAVYVLHWPVGQIAQMVGNDFATSHHRAAALLFLVVIVFIAWLADAFYDAPVRRMLSRLTKSTKAPGNAGYAGSHSSMTREADRPLSMSL